MSDINWLYPVLAFALSLLVTPLVIMLFRLVERRVDER
jgi:hypothetical protein